jgi:hypothetical protein
MIRNEDVAIRHAQARSAIQIVVLDDLKIVY